MREGLADEPLIIDEIQRLKCLVVYLGTECIGFGEGLLAVPASALAGTPIAA